MKTEIRHKTDRRKTPGETGQAIELNRRKTVNY